MKIANILMARKLLIYILLRLQAQTYLNLFDVLLHFLFSAVSFGPTLPFCSGVDICGLGFHPLRTTIRSGCYCRVPRLNSDIRRLQHIRNVSQVSTLELSNS